MTPDAQKPKEYIITEEIAARIERHYNSGGKIPYLRYRPHTPAPSVSRNKEGDLTLTYDYGSLLEHDAAIARTATLALIPRLQELKNEIDEIDIYPCGHGPGKAYDLIEGIIESLRQQAGEQE